MKGKHEKTQFSALLALALCAVLVVTFMPNLMFRANAEENAKSAAVQSFNSIGDTALEADSAESAQTKVSSTYATVTGTVSEDGSEKTDVSIPVKWTQDTAKSSDSSYVFQAQLKDEENKDTDGDGIIYSLKDSSVTLPEVTVKKVESASAETADSNQSSSEKIYGTRKSTVTTFTNPTADSLGSVGKFGVFANDYEQTGDMEGSVATQNLLSYNAQIGKSARVLVYDPNESYDYIGTFNTAFRSHAETKEDWIFGDNVNLDNQNGLRAIDGETEIDWNQVSELGSSAQNAADSPYTINFADVFNGLRAYASAQYNKSNTGVDVDNNVGKPGVDQNNYEIKVKCSEGFDIVNLSASDLQKAKLTITGPSNGNYSLIINVTGMTSDCHFTKDVEIDGEKTGFSSKIGRVLFNFGSYNGNIKYDGNSYAGVILAPDATVNFSTGHHAGSVYADKVVSSVEIHQIDFIPVTPTPTPTPSHAKLNFAVKKTFDGDWSGKTGKNFSFDLTGNDNAPMPNSHTVEISSNDVSAKNNSKTAQFGNIEFTDAGTYHYTIKEGIPSDTKDNVSDGVKYDPTVYHVTVVTEKDTDGNISIKSISYTKDNDKTDHEYTQGDNTTPFTFSNSSVGNEEKTTSIKVNKVWKNESGDKIPAPAKSSVTVQLQKKVEGDTDFSDVDGKTVDLNENNKWEDTFKDLPTETKDGKKITYQVRETKINGNDVQDQNADGYSSSVKHNNDGSFTITNTKEKTSPTSTTATLSVTKMLQEDGKPVKDWNGKSFTFTLTRDANKSPADTPMPKNTKNGVSEVKINSNGSQNQYKAAFGQITYYNSGTYIYTITEDSSGQAAGVKYDTVSYQVTVTVDQNMKVSVNYHGSNNTEPKSETGALFINTLNTTPQVEKTSVKVQKVWSGTRGTAVIRLLADGKQAVDVDGNPVSDWNVGAGSDDLNHTFDNLPKKDSSGKTITYTVQEISINGHVVKKNKDGNYQAGNYFSSVNEDKGVWIVTNTEQTTSVSGTKVWNDGSGNTHPSSITVNLLKKNADGSTEKTEKVDAKTVSADKDGNWNFSFDNLPK